MSENPYSAPVSEVAPESSSVIEPLTKVTGWMLLQGVVMMILGGFAVLGGIGIMFAGSVMALMGVLYLIVAGVMLAIGLWYIQAGSRLKPYNMDSPDVLTEGAQKLAAVIRLQGIMMLAYILIIVIAIVVGIGGAMAVAR